jgi:hypothetical protein
MLFPKNSDESLSFFEVLVNLSDPEGKSGPEKNLKASSTRSVKDIFVSKTTDEFFSFSWLKIQEASIKVRDGRYKPTPVFF